MSKEDLQFPVFEAIHQQTGTDTQLHATTLSSNFGVRSGKFGFAVDWDAIHKTKFSRPHPGNVVEICAENQRAFEVIRSSKDQVIYFEMHVFFCGIERRKSDRAGFCILPRLRLVMVTLTAGNWKIFHPDPRIGFLAEATRLDAFVTGLNLAMVLAILIDCSPDA